VAELSLPAGSYVVTGKAQIDNTSDDKNAATCQLNEGLDSMYVPLEPTFGVGGVSLEAALVLTEPGTATFSCRPGGTASALHVRLTAIKVGEIRTQ